MALLHLSLAAHKRRLALLVAGCVLASSVVAGCGPSVSKVIGEPDRYYGNVLRLQGRIGEIVTRSDTGEARVFHLVSKHGHRMIVIPTPPVGCRLGDRVYVRGEFLHERTVAGRTYYDVVSATTIGKSGIRRWIPFM